MLLINSSRARAISLPEAVLSLEIKRRSSLLFGEVSSIWADVFSKYSLSSCIFSVAAMVFEGGAMDVNIDSLASGLEMSAVSAGAWGLDGGTSANLEGPAN